MVSGTECGVLAYNGGLRAEPPAGREAGKAPGQRGVKPQLKLKAFQLCRSAK